MLKVNDIVKVSDISKNEDFKGIIKAKVITELDMPFGEDYVTLKVLEHKDASKIGTEYTVENNSKDFEIIPTESIDSKKINKNTVKELLCKYLDTELNTAKDVLLRAERVRDDKRKYYIESLKDYENARLNYEGVKAKNIIKSNEIEHATKELESILNDPKCTDIEILNDKIIIYTPHLYIDLDEYYDIGHFKMNKYKITLNPENHKTYITGIDKNYSRTSCWGSECPHPHISISGEPCWGNTSAMIIDAVDKKDFYTAFMIIINYLETFNYEDQAGKNICNWDFVDINDDSIILDCPEEFSLKEADCGCSCDNDEVRHCSVCGYTMCIDCYYICDSCGEVYCDEHSEYYNSIGERLCESCLEDKYVWIESKNSYYHMDDTAQCEHCNDSYLKEHDDSVHFRYNNCNYDFCSEDCAMEYGFEKCESCDEWIRTSDCIIVDNDDEEYPVYLCNKDCAEDSGYVKCDQCDEYVHEDDTIDLNDKVYCSNGCVENDNYTNCENCGEWINRDDFIICVYDNKGNTIYFCDDNCAESGGYYICHSCDKYVKEDDLIVVSNNNYCSNSCAEDDGCCICGNCGDWSNKEYPISIEVEDGTIHYCSTDCAYKDGVSCCPVCLKYFDTYKKETIFIQGENKVYCSESCANIDKYIKCNTCDKHHKTDAKCEEKDLLAKEEV